jgi:protein-export membrane protein SecD
MNVSKRWVFLGIFLLALFLIFFVGRVSDPVTGKRQLSITNNGLQHFRKGLDVSWGTRLVYKIGYEKYETIYQDVVELNAVKKVIEDIIIKNIDKRISKLGVSDYKAFIQRLDDQRYIAVEIGGIADLDQAKEIIGKTLELEFKLENKEPVSEASLATRKATAQKLLDETKTNPDLMMQLAEGKGSESIYLGLYSGTIDQLPDIYRNNIQIVNTLKEGEISPLLEGTYITLSPEDDIGITTGSDIKGFTFFQVLRTGSVFITGVQQTVYQVLDIFVKDRIDRIQAIDDGGNVLNGAYFRFANTSSSEIGQPVVAINFDDKGKEVFCNLTERNIGNPMAIFIGGELLTSPVIQTKICGGTAQIDGSFTAESAKELATALNDWAMPAPLILMQEEKINPSLGMNALNGALIAGLIGLIAIAVYIFFMYGLKKMILTLIVLITFITILAGFMKLTDYALSLSGIAAIILSIGMGVDANILIYERLREELKKGKSIDWAIDTAKEKSRSAIRDGQLSTGLIAFLLFTMGTNMFKGFGFMMLLTLVLTLFINVPLTKELLHIFYSKKD